MPLVEPMRDNFHKKMHLIETMRDILKKKKNQRYLPMNKSHTVPFIIMPLPPGYPTFSIV